MAPPHRLLLVFMVFAYAFCPVSFVRPVRTGNCQRLARQTLQAVRIKQATGGSDDWRRKDQWRSRGRGFGGSGRGGRNEEQTWQDDDLEDRGPGTGGYSDSPAEDLWESDSEDMSWNAGRQPSSRGDPRNSERPAGREERYSDGDDRSWREGSDDRGLGGGFDEMSSPRSRDSSVDTLPRRDVEPKKFRRDVEPRQQRGHGDDRRNDRGSSRGRGFGGGDGALQERRTWNDDEWRMTEDDWERERRPSQSWSQDETMNVVKRQGFYNVWQTVWVRGFDFKTPEAVLRKHFATAGDVVDFWFDPRGAALVRYKTIEDARNAVAKLDRTTLEGNRRYIDVLLRSEMAAQPVLEETSVFVDGFDYGTRTAGLMKHFRTVGKVLHVDLLTKSSAIVQYESPEEAEAAFETLDGTTVPGNKRYLRVLPLMPAAISVWGFDYETTKEDIVKHCSQAGEVLYAFKESKGASIVQYGSLEAAERAVKMLDKTYMIGQNRYVAAQLHNINRRVFVSNLPVNTRWQDLKDHMRAAGDILFCNIVPNPEPRRGSKGDYGLVEYATPAEAQDAISKLSRSKFDGNTVFVQPDRDLTQREKTTLIAEYNREQGNEGDSQGAAMQEPSMLEDDPRIPRFASLVQPVRG
eukprot:TRINITY_DN62225_c0_g1_i1.p1 TRINITY_DN62225_c0_g1~~TRINITY_DN62225_c0_g1_i1.p1  ORF type:complete len:634 (+),score=109.65 TRINITY_DN62225_c0_g1_i1:23-1924(+)